MSPTHKQTFWTIDVGTGDIGTAKRAQIAKAALMLQKHSLVVHSSSAGGYGNAEKPEIALTVDIAFTKTQVLQGEVEAALAKEGLPGVTVVLEQDVHWFTFGDAHLGALKASVINDVPLARRSIDELVRAPGRKPTAGTPTNLATELAAILSQFDGHNPSNAVKATPILGTDASDIPNSELAEMMLITEEKHRRMRDARDGNVEAEVNGLKDALVAISNATKTNTAVASMVSNGLVAVGKLMVKAYKDIGPSGSLSAAISSAITAIGGVSTLAGIAAAVAAVILALVVFLKDAVNQVVLLNGLEKTVNFTRDSVINGERFKITLDIPAAVKSPEKPLAYGCGFYIYRKTRWLDHPVGFYGSTIGAAFKVDDNTEFSVGVDCPNSAFGGTNSIRVEPGSDAGGAGKAAGSSGHSTDSIIVNGHSCVASRASAWGYVNFGICSIE